MERTAQEGSLRLGTDGRGRERLQAQRNTSAAQRGGRGLQELAHPNTGCRPRSLEQERPHPLAAGEGRSVPLTPAMSLELGLSLLPAFSKSRPHPD